MEEVRMKKAEELYAYSCGHNFGKDLSRAKGLTNFHLIEEAMDPDEFAFIGSTVCLLTSGISPMRLPTNGCSWHRCAPSVGHAWKVCRSTQL